MAAYHFEQWSGQAQKQTQQAITSSSWLSVSTGSQCAFAFQKYSFWNAKKERFRIARGSNQKTGYMEPFSWNLTIFITTVCRFHFIKWSPVRVCEIGPKHYKINKVTVMYSQSAAFHSYLLRLINLDWYIDIDHHVVDLSWTAFTIYLLFLLGGGGSCFLITYGRTTNKVLIIA